MASGKPSKRRRAVRRAAPPPVRSTTPRTDRRWWVVAAVGAAIALAIAAALVLDRGDEASPQAGSTLPDSVEAAAVFDGIPQRGVSLGRADAPVTLLEFVDLQCPYCREFAVEAVPTLVEKHVRTGRVRIEIRGLAFLGADSERGMRASFAAAQQGRMFELMELLYYNQGPENSGWLSDELIEAAARSLPGIDAGRLVDDMDSDSVSALLEEHAADAEGRGVDGTPTIFVGPTGGELTKVTLASPTDVPAVEQAIAAA